MLLVDVVLWNLLILCIYNVPHILCIYIAQLCERARKTKQQHCVYVQLKPPDSHNFYKVLISTLIAELFKSFLQEKWKRKWKHTSSHRLGAQSTRVHLQENHTLRRLLSSLKGWVFDPAFRTKTSVEFPACTPFRAKF